MTRTRACTPGPKANQCKQEAEAAQRWLDKVSAHLQLFRQQNDLDQEDLDLLAEVRRDLFQVAKKLNGHLHGMTGFYEQFAKA